MEKYKEAFAEVNWCADKWRISILITDEHQRNWIDFVDRPRDIGIQVHLSTIFNHHYQRRRHHHQSSPIIIVNYWHRCPDRLCQHHQLSSIVIFSIIIKTDKANDRLANSSSSRCQTLRKNKPVHHSVIFFIKSLNHRACTVPVDIIYKLGHCVAVFYDTVTHISAGEKKEGNKK